MKTLVKRQLCILALLCAPCMLVKGAAFEGAPQNSEAPAGQTPQKGQDYTNPLDLMTDFLDVTKKPNEKILYWARQFVFLFHKDPKLKGFCKEIAEAARFKNVNRIGSAFILNQDKFSQELRTQLLARGFPVVKKILEERVKK